MVDGFAFIAISLNDFTSFGGVDAIIAISDVLMSEVFNDGSVGDVTSVQIGHHDDFLDVAHFERVVIAGIAFNESHDSFFDVARGRSTFGGYVSIVAPDLNHSMWIGIGEDLSDDNGIRRALDYRINYTPHRRITRFRAGHGIRR